MNVNHVQLVIISGRSGSGKSIALKVLEDLGYYCIDNLPADFLPSLIKLAQTGERYSKLAVSLDIRNKPEKVERLDRLYAMVKSNPLLDSIIIYLDAADQVLIRRYLETRRLHPLSRNHLSLAQAITKEKELLSEIAAAADIRLDSSSTSVHELASSIHELIMGKKEKDLVIVFESFGFKNGIAQDADFVFDARFLPNPFWEKELRPLSGLDDKVKEFFKHYPEVDLYISQIDELLSTWIKALQKNNRSYLTVAIGCTGGFHRSVYIAQSLYEIFKRRSLNVQLRHKSLEKSARD